MRFVSFDAVAARFKGKRVAVVGSAPTVLDNQVGLIDSHDVVVRVNNYKLGPAQGKRTDVHYSFYGNSIRKERAALEQDGVSLCMCKCPNSKPLTSEWHEVNRKPEGVDYRYIYRLRADWWFCDTWVPTDEEFLWKFQILNSHIPSTGLAAVMDILLAQPEELYLTGFDFFTSGKHNVDEPWKEGRRDDPIRHRPDLERQWIVESLREIGRRIKLDSALSCMLSQSEVPS